MLGRHVTQCDDMGQNREARGEAAGGVDPEAVVDTGMRAAGRFDMAWSGRDIADLWANGTRAGGVRRGAEAAITMARRLLEYI